MLFISYEAAERNCAQLARMIRDQLGAELPSSRFIAIPRGGLIVLGMISYWLGLNSDQLSADPGAPDQVAVVVDDCSLSGARFASALEALPNRRVVFAHLCSHPDLRKAIVEAEPRVEAVLAVQDLPDRQGISPEQRQKALAFGREHSRGKYYWIGLTEQLAFAWGEPDFSLWDDRTQDFEAWHAVSPRHCLEGRADLGLPMPFATGAIDLAEAVCWRLEGDTVVVWQRTQDRVYGLKSVAGDMWRALLAYGEIERAADDLLGRYAVEREKLLTDLKSFLQDLLDKGILVQSS